MRSRAGARVGLLIPALTGLAACSAPPPPPPPPPRVIEWRAWTPEAFADAARLGKPIYAYVGTTWCHWCHVMKETTLADPEIVALLREHFVCIKADAEARPELGERFIRIGWPANVILTPDARPMREHAGYWEPARFKQTLEQVVAAKQAGSLQPLPPERPARSTGGLAKTRDLVRKRLDAAYSKRDGWTSGNIMYPRWAPVEHAFLRSWHEPLAAEWERRALASLGKYTKLIDPVWGGVYQYSDDGTWTSPHYEKIVAVQAGVLEVFALAHLRTRDARWLKAAGQVARFLDEWLATPDKKAFFAAQDAEPPKRAVEAGLDGDRYFALDDAGRRRYGAPRVDRRLFSEHNARIAAALARLHAALQSEQPTKALKRARATVEHLLETVKEEHDDRWVVRHLLVPSAVDLDAPGRDLKPEPAHEQLRHLRDQVELGRALLALFQVTGETRWLEGAQALARGLVHTFRDPKGGGFFAHTEDPTAVGVFKQRRKPYRDNSRAARFLIHLDALSGTTTWREHAEAALKSQANEEALRGRASTLGPFLLALEELDRSPTVLAVAVRADDPALPRFLRAAHQAAAGTALVRRVDPGGPYPAKRAAIYVCDASRCSSPITDLTRLPKELATFLRNRAR